MTEDTKEISFMQKIPIDIYLMESKSEKDLRYWFIHLK